MVASGPDNSRRIEILRNVFTPCRIQSVRMPASLFGKLVDALTGARAATDDDGCRCGVEIEAVEGES